MTSCPSVRAKRRGSATLPTMAAVTVYWPGMTGTTTSNRPTLSASTFFTPVPGSDLCATHTVAIISGSPVSLSITVPVTLHIGAVAGVWAPIGIANMTASTVSIIDSGFIGL